MSSFYAKWRKMGIFSTLHRFNILLILHLTFLFYDDYRDEDNQTNTNLMKKEITNNENEKVFCNFSSSRNGSITGCRMWQQLR